MTDDDGTLCWRLLLIANSVTVGWAWWYRRQPAARRWPHIAALVALAAVVAATALQCGLPWGAATLLVAAGCGRLCVGLFRGVR
jgi:uncharacterized BrkB/YihY/UPF0761 family membrane protein